MLNVWMPCDVKNERCFWILYIFQGFSTAYMSLLHVTNDILIFAFLSNINMQFNLLGLRFEQISSVEQTSPNQNLIVEMEDIKIKKLSDCIEDHVDIIK